MTDLGTAHFDWKLEQTIHDFIQCLPVLQRDSFISPDDFYVL